MAAGSNECPESWNASLFPHGGNGGISHELQRKHLHLSNQSKLTAPKVKGRITVYVEIKDPESQSNPVERCQG
jgi:hypothetical protein